MELQTFSKTAVVENVEGRVFYVDANGAQIFVKSGDLIPAGSVVVSLSGAQYEIHSSGGQFRVVGQCATCDDDNRGFVAKALESDDEIARLQDAILAGADPTEDFEPPAGGMAVSSTNAGFVEIERLNSQTIADAGFDTNNNFVDGYDSELKDLGSSDEDAPEFSITLHGPITADNIINDAETAQMITITGSVSDSVKPGTQVIVTVGDQTYTATVDENGNFSVDVPGSQLAQDTEVSAELATDSDVKDTISYEVDTDISVPTVSLNPDSNSGDKDDQTTNVTQPALDIGNVDDDVVHVEVTLTGPSGTITGEAVETENGWEFIPSEPLEDGEYDVTITVTDDAGNTASNQLDDPLIIDTVATPPTITFEDPGSDGIYNQAELGPDGTVTATVTLPDDFDPAKDKLVINGVEHTLTDDEIAAGKVDIQVTPNETVDAQITDAAGNTSDLASETAPDADITCPAPSVEFIGDTNSDGVFNINEIGLDGTITAEVTLATGTEVGDRIIVKDTDGNVLLDKTVTQDDLDNGIQVEVPVGSGTQVGVTAQITDPAGNVSPEGSDSAAVDNEVAPAPSVSLLGDTNGDGVYNIEELGANGTVTAEVTLASGTEVGDRIIIKDTDGSVLVDREITQADLDNGIQVEVSVVGNNVEVTAQVVDAAGNPSPEATDSALVDNQEPSAPTITFEDPGADGIYNNEELGPDGTVTATVTLPDDFDPANDKLVINGVEHTLTPEEIAAGKVEFQVDPSETVTAQITDAAGNDSALTTETAPAADIVAQAPTISFEDPGADGIYNSEELGPDGTVTATVTLPDDFDPAKDTLFINGVEHTLTPEEIAAGKVEFQVDPSETVTAQITDAAGNDSALTTETAPAADTQAQAPTISFEDPGADGIYNNEELGPDGTVTATVTLPDDFDPAKDTLFINGVEHTLTPEEIAAGKVEFQVDPSETVTAQITDAAGNDSALTTETAPAADTQAQAPTISFEDPGADGIYNSEELGPDGTVTATVTLPDDFDPANDKLVINGVEHTLTPEEIAAGKVEFQVDPSETVTAQITDAAGNDSALTTETAPAADIVAQAPTISFEDPGADGIYNSEELGPDGTVTATVTLPDDFDPAKDTLFINGVEYTLTPEEIAAGKVEFQVDPSETVTAQITDAAGNDSALTTETAPDADIEAQAPTITFEDPGVDGIYNSEELGPDGTVTATVTLPNDFDPAKDTLFINGVEHTLTPEEIAAGKVEFQVDPSENVTAQITDAAGNDSALTTETAPAADTQAQAPTITFEDPGADGIYNNEELGPDGTVTATVTLPDDFDPAKDTLFINGVEHTLTPEEIAAGKVEFQVDPSENVTAQITDAAGNDSALTTETAPAADTQAQAPTITFEDPGADGIYNNEELGPDGTVTATVTLPDDFDPAKDTLFINGVEHTLTPEEMAAGKVEFQVDPSETVTAQITDAAGNDSAQTTETAPAADTQAQAPTISFEDPGADGIYNNEELGPDGTVTATVTLPDDFDPANDKLVINGVEHTLTPEEIAAGKVEFQVDPSETVTAQITDAAGNDSALTTETAPAADIVAQAPTITFEDPGADGIYNSEELGPDGTVTATVALPDDFDPANDKLVINGVEHTLTPEEIAAGKVEFQVDPSETVTAQITDAAGNDSALTTETAPDADIVAQAPTISFEDPGADGIYNNEELGPDGTVTATVTLPDDFDPAKKDTLFINGVEHTLTPEEIAAGKVEFQVDPSETVTAQITDAAGNDSTLTTETAPAADTQAQAPTISFEDPGADGIYNSEELGPDGTVTATVTLPDDFDPANDKLVINGVEHTLTPEEIAAGKVEFQVDPSETVTAQITDAAGNDSALTTETAPDADIEAQAPTITFEDPGADGIYNSEELGPDGTVTATVTLPDDFDPANDKLVINGVEHTLTPEEIASGKVEFQVDPSETVTAQITDSAGNDSALTSETAPAADTQAQAPTISFEDPGADGIYNNEELGPDGTVTATVTLPDDFDPAKDTLFINGVEHTLTPEEIAAGKVEFQVDPSETVTAQITDAAGNDSALTTETAPDADIVAQAPTISFEDPGADGIYNNEELGLDGTVTATVTLPDDFDPAKDTLFINGVEHTLTPEEIAAGKVEFQVDPSETVTAQITDAAGNDSALTTETAPDADIVAQAPTITFEDPGVDGIYNNEELGPDGTVTATVTLPDDFDPAKDTLFINGVEHTLTPEEIATGKVEFQVDPSETVTAQITDAAGNDSALTTETAPAADTQAQAPTISFEDPGADGIYNSEELGPDGTVTATVTLPDDFDSAKDTLFINGVEHTLTQEEIAAGKVEFQVDPSETVTAQITDAAGNDSALTTETAPDADIVAQAPTISFEDPGVDGIYNSEELGPDGTVTATVTLPDDFDSAKDTLFINGVEHTLTPEDIAAGKVEFQVDPSETVTAQITDAAGNDSALTTETAPDADIEAQAPTITFEDPGADGIYNSEELGPDGTVTATVTLPDDFDPAKDTLFINGVEHTLTSEEIAAGKVEFQVDPSETVTAQITDAAGNDSTLTTETAPDADIEAQAPTITFEDPGADGIYNSEELGPDGTVTATVTLPDDFDPAKDTLFINGVEHTLTSEEIAAGKVEFQVDPSETVTAQITDAAGNDSTLTTETAPDADITCPAPSIEFVGDTDGDGVFNIDEIGADNSITAKVTLTTGTEVGDRIVVQDASGKVLLDKTVTQDDLNNGIQVEVPVGDSTQVEVTAQVTDPAGNTSPEASDSALVDSEPAPAPSVELLGDTNGDGIFNLNEVSAGAESTVSAQVTLQPGTQVGDRIIIKDTTGAILVEREVTQNDLDNGIQVEVSVGTVSGKDGVFVSAQVVDAAGNPSSVVTDSAEVDVNISTPVADLDSSNDTGVSDSDDLTYLKQPEINLDGIDDDVQSIVVTVTSSTGEVVRTGEAHWVNGQWQLSGGLELANGKWSFQPIDPLDDGRYEISVSVTDRAGNSATSDQNNPLIVTVDTTTQLNDSDFRDDENTVVAGQEVGRVLSGTETDIVQVGFHYNGAFHSVSEDGFFSIDNDGVIRITQAGIDAGLNDYEIWSTMKDGNGSSLTGSYTIKATDEAGNIETRDFSYAVNDVPEPVDAQGQGGDDNLYVVNNQMTYAYGATHDENGNPIAGAVKDPDSYDPSMGAVIDGAAGNDHIIGGSGNDVIIGGVNGQLHGGGAGEANGRHYGDVLEGRGGQDIFRWLSGDDVELNHIVDSENDGVAVDIIVDFTLGNTSTNDQADILDLSDLLQGETADTLDKYLSVEQDGNNLIISIDTDGDGAKGVTQQIIMENMGGVDANTFIDDLLNNGQLTID